VVKAGGFVSRVPRARALAAGARMFVTSQVPFFPNQQYGAVVRVVYLAVKNLSKITCLNRVPVLRFFSPAVCTLIYTLN
jgi:hypothetical protein